MSTSGWTSNGNYPSPRMDFALSDDQREIQALARELARAENEPNAAEWDRAHAFPQELLGKLAKLGLMCVCIPEAYAGTGADFLSYVLVFEALSRSYAGGVVSVTLHTSALSRPI